MPVFPTYDSKRNINATPASPILNEAAKPFQDNEKMITAATDIVQKWSDAHDVMQYTQKKAAGQVELAKIEAEASVSNDFSKENVKSFQDRIAKVKQNMLVGIDNAAVANKLAMELDLDTQISSIKVASGFRKKEIDFGKLDLQSAVDGLVQKKLNSPAGSPEEAEYDTQMRELIQSYISRDIISYEEADKMLKAAQKTGVEYKVYSDDATQESESEILAELKKADGKFKFLDPDSRLAMIKKSQDRIYQNNQTMKRQIVEVQNTRTNSFIQDLMSYKVDLKRIDDEVAIPEDQGGIKREMLKTARAAVINPLRSSTGPLADLVNTNAKAADFYRFIDKFIYAEEDVDRAREQLLKMYADGRITGPEGAYLDQIKRAALDIQQKDSTAANNLGNAIRTAWRSFTSYRTPDPQASANAIHEILLGASKGQDPQKVADRVVQDDLFRRNPNVARVPDEGIVQDIWGNFKVGRRDKDGILRFSPLEPFKMKQPEAKPTEKKEEK